MIFEVEMVAFKSAGRDFGIREVDVPQDELAKDVYATLESVFRYGQNDFQPRKLPSVSVGDVIRYKGKRYMVDVAGFTELGPGEEGGYEKAYKIGGKGR